MEGFDEIQLGEDNIFTSEEDLFGLEEKPKQQVTEDTKEPPITEVNVQTLFEVSPESVGSEGDKTKEEESADDPEDISKSPTVFSSIADALKEEGTFSTLTEEDIKVKSAEDFSDLIDKEVLNRLDSAQQRVIKALNGGVEPDEIKQFENTINYLSSIKEEDISDESEKGIKLRQNLIFQDYINKGYSKERATREVEKSFKIGSDIEDATEALSSNSTHFKDSYDAKINEGLEAQRQEKQKEKEDGIKLHNLIKDTAEPFKGISVSNEVKKKIFDNISKPVYTDENGDKYTAIQKFEKENKSEFMYKLGVLFTLTDGFKNVDNLIKGEVTKQTKSKLRELEGKISNSGYNGSGALSYMSGSAGIDSESFEGLSGLKLDV